MGAGSIFGAAKRGLGMLGRMGKKKPTPTPKPSRPKTAKEKHDEFMQEDPFVRGKIISARESARRGDVYKGTTVVGTPGPHRTAESIKKYHGKGSYQLTDPARKRRGPKAVGGRIGLKQGGSNEWWTGVDPKNPKRKLYDPRVDKKLREGKPHTTPEGRWRHVAGTYGRTKYQAQKARAEKAKREAEKGSPEVITPQPKPKGGKV